MKILILGAEGLFGRSLQAAFPRDAVMAWGRRQCDVGSRQAGRLIVRARPDVVINAAAWTDVDGAEAKANWPAVHAVNCGAVKGLLAACDEIEARLLHISTNEVFPGRPGEVYAESAATRPVNAYGRSKAAGEDILRPFLARHCLVRVSWLFGPYGEHFPSKIIRAADRLGALRVVNDEIGCPTYAVDAARVVHALVRREACGIFHVTNEGATSRYDWARFVLDASGRAAVPITPIASREWQRPATAPRHAVLRDTRLRTEGLGAMPSWRNAMRRFLTRNA